MTQQKDGPRHYELQHRVAGSWRETAVYEMYPRHFRAFLDYINVGRSAADQENVRVIAVETVWGNAEYEFDGKTHKKIKNDDGYDPTP